MTSYCRVPYRDRMNVHRRDLASLKKDLHNHYNAGDGIRHLEPWEPMAKDSQMKDRYVKMFPHNM